MADKKISALTAATTPLAGTEVLPIVQSGTTKKVSVSDLTAGRVAAVNGVQFPSVQVPSTNVNLLDDYEEGTWTPSVGGDATYTIQEGLYVKVGRFVYVQGKIAVNVLGTGAANVMSGLPFAAVATPQSTGGAGAIYYFGSLASSVTSLVPWVNPGTANVYFGSLGAAASSMTGVTTVFQNGTRIDFCLNYYASA